MISVRLIVFNIILMNGTLSAPLTAGGQPETQRGQCEGSAYNYILSVPSFQDCVQKCECDQGCRHYSYHHSEESGPHHNHCYLYSGSCDRLRYNTPDSHWLSGPKPSSPSCPPSQSLTNPVVGGMQTLIHLRST